MKVVSMIHNRYVFLYILLMAQCVVYGMEQQEAQKPMQTIAIRGTDGNKIYVSQDVAMQASMMSNYFSDARDVVEGEKEVVAGETIDFTQEFGKYNGIFHDASIIN